MILGGIFAKLFGKKTLIFIGILATLIAVGSFLYYRLDSVKESLVVAKGEIDKMALHLEQSERTLDEFEKELQLRERLVVQRERASRENVALAEKLSEQLKQEINSNAKLQECLTIDMSSYVDSMPISPDKDSEPATAD